MEGQGELFHETLTDALRATVDALGGSKVVASLLWHEKSVDEGRRHLLDCLNPDRQQRLDPEHLLLLLKLARAKGAHTAMAWILNDCGYAPPAPIEPVDELAELERAFIRAAANIESIAKRIDRVRLKVATG